MISQKTLDRLSEFREESFHTSPKLRLNSAEEAIQFVNKRGFVFFWPDKDLIFPSLWSATAGDRSVPNNHDDPGHVTWGWKDQLLDKRCWFYARVLRKRNTIISLDTLPYFYAISPNYGDYKTDHLERYEQGLLTAEAKTVYGALLRDGPLDTIALRFASNMTSKTNPYRFKRALNELQLEFKILPVGISRAGAWRYAFIYDIVPRHFAGLPEKSHRLTETKCRIKLLELYLLSVGAGKLLDVSRLFGWDINDTEFAVKNITAKSDDYAVLEHQNKKESWIIIKDLL
ncbi:MAG: hypothetical protein MUO76_10760 [Anaerolineaceae bacterium]|nr:hypothetical protein [Anaerolineaceae bacterium]